MLYTAFNATEAPNGSKRPDWILESGLGFFLGAYYGLGLTALGAVIVVAVTYDQRFGKEVFLKSFSEKDY